MNLPDFIVVGAAKSATTTLYDLLSRHEEVYIPELKECRFFSQMPTDKKGGYAAKFQNEGVRSLSEYQELFCHMNDKIKGDISNDYFYYYERSISNIKKVYKSAGLDLPKIIMILRRPDDRVYSMYHHSVRLGSESLSFDDAFKSSDLRIKDNYAWVFDLKRVGLSCDAVRSYLNNFPDCYVFLTEDFSNELDGVFSFLNISVLNGLEVKNKNDYVAPKSMLFNRLFVSFSLYTNKLIKWWLPDQLLHALKRTYILINRLNGGVKDELNNKQRKKLMNFYADDILCLQTLIGKNLSKWLER